MKEEKHEIEYEEREHGSEGKICRERKLIGFLGKKGREEDPFRHREGEREKEREKRERERLDE